MGGGNIFQSIGDTIEENIRKARNEAEDIIRNSITNPIYPITEGARDSLDLVGVSSKPLNDVLGTLDKTSTLISKPISSVVAPVANAVLGGNFNPTESPAAAIPSEAESSAPGVSDVAGRKRKKRSVNNLDQFRAGLASTVMTAPSGLLGGGAQGGAPVAGGKTKLGV